MRTLCFGGTFNPIHHGHLACARAVAEAAGFDRVVLIPNQQSPHKPEVAETAAGFDRLAMCRLAVAGDPLFDVDGVELDRRGPSYTIDTVRFLRDRGERHVHWLVGADLVSALPLWHDATALLAEAQFVVMARPGWAFDWSALPAPFRSLAAHVVTAPLLEISSTDIRRRVREGRSIRYLTPPAVVDYIRDRSIYRRETPVAGPQTTVDPRPSSR